MADRGESRDGPGWGGVVGVSLAMAVLVNLGAMLVQGGAFGGGAGGSVQVPDVVGMSPEAAAELLSGRGLRLVVADEQASPEVTEGDIAEQSPLAGSQVDPGERVDVIVSTGTPLVEIPDVVGEPVEDARRSIEEEGLAIGDVSETGDGVAGTVTATDPAPGESVPPESEVALTAVPAGIEVPDLVGEVSREAREQIEEMGLEVGEIHRRYTEGRPWEVIDQDPAAGTVVEPGSEVELTIVAY